ncbi:hypothetical protein GTA08_BOTSDO08966 [Botryosphaeria dothidea]|uniref:Uncharacterized protein n=1 Tax=Botryosphaeria dothidea TaxID=55169 RepID=A0A8H4IKS8_9PEZI|nr:hypothetical protein GTA08_BOTSDO08966 [Botryosphaeria dothidea]
MAAHESRTASSTDDDDDERDLPAPKRKQPLARTGNSSPLPETSPPPPPPAPTPQRSSASPLLGLAREIRDLIFDAHLALLHTLAIPKPLRLFTTPLVHYSPRHVRNAAQLKAHVLSVRLVNHQFSAEYLDAQLRHCDRAASYLWVVRTIETFGSPKSLEVGAFFHPQLRDPFATRLVRLEMRFEIDLRSGVSDFSKTINEAVAPITSAIRTLQELTVTLCLRNHTRNRMVPWMAQHCGRTDYTFPGHYIQRFLASVPTTHPALRRVKNRVVTAHMAELELLQRSFEKRGQEGFVIVSDLNRLGHFWSFNEGSAARFLVQLGIDRPEPLGPDLDWPDQFARDTGSFPTVRDWESRRTFVEGVYERWYEGLRPRVVTLIEAERRGESVSWDLSSEG